MRSDTSSSVISLQNILEGQCTTLLKEEQIYFAVFINKNGRLVAGAFKPDMKSVDEFQRELLFMSNVLITSLNKDLDDCLGKLRYVVSKRENLAMISYSIGSLLFLVAVDARLDIDNEAKRIEKTVKNVIPF